MQGFASGDCVKDGQAIQIFLKAGLPMALSQSYAKNMGMYGQRIGALSIVCENAQEAQNVESQLKAVARAMYSNPPCHGAYLVHEILSDPALKAQWCGPRPALRCRLSNVWIGGVCFTLVCRSTGFTLSFKQANH